MPETDANGNPAGLLPPWKVKAVLNGTQKKGTVTWRGIDPLISANFRITDSESELRRFEDGQIVELG